MTSTSIPSLEPVQDVPFTISEEGTIRITGTRVSLDSILHHYQQGGTAEEIALRFPGLRLADIHSALAYFLNHQRALQQYLLRQEQHSSEWRQRISADPNQQAAIAEMRERIQRRSATRMPQPF